MTKFKNLKIEKLTESIFPSLVDLEQKIYFNDAPQLIQGVELIKDIKEGNGLEYSFILSGEREEGKVREAIGYIVAIEEKDEHKHLICVEDIAVVHEAQRQGLGWKIMEHFIKNLNNTIKKKDKSIFIDMYLRESSQAFMKKHKEGLIELGVELVKEEIITDYHGKGQNALYQQYDLVL